MLRWISASFVVAASAHAADRPATWDMSRRELEAVGLGQSRGDPVPMPLVTGSRPSRAEGDNVIFVNFDEITMAATPGEDSQSDSTGIFPGQHFAAYGGAMAERAAVMQAVRADWAAYNIVVVDQRPSSGDYTMNVTSPTNPLGAGVLGIAPLDCHDAMPNNVTFAFHGAQDGFGPAIQATTIGQEVAHSFGLEHVDEPGDIMNPYNAGGDPAFLDKCIDVVANGAPVLCGMQHAEHCGSQTSQNAHQELLTLFGPSTPDHEPPSVTITEPADGAQFEVGSEFHIAVEASDDVALAEVQLFNGSEALQVDVTEPFGWDVSNIPEGAYLFKAVATDIAGNSAGSAIVHVYIGVEPPPMEMEDSSGGGSGGSGEEDGTGGGGQDGGGGGCGCHSAQAPSELGLLGLAVLVFVRRRRVHGAA